MFCFISVLSRGGWISTPVMSQTSQRLHWGGVRRQLFSADWFFPVGLFSDRVRCNVDGQAGTWGLALVGLVDLAPWTGLWAAWNAVAEAPASEPTCSKSTTLLWLSSTRYRHKLYTFIQKAALSPSYRATLSRLLPDLFRHTFNPKKKSLRVLGGKMNTGLTTVASVSFHNTKEEAPEASSLIIKRSVPGLDTRWDWPPAILNKKPIKLENGSCWTSIT